jgi:hypothetical protein
MIDNPTLAIAKNALAISNPLLTQTTSYGSPAKTARPFGPTALLRYTDIIRMPMAFKVFVADKIINSAFPPAGVTGQWSVSVIP